MNTTDLLAAVFADHEDEAPDATDTRLAIEAEIAARTGRRRVVTTLAIGGAAATVAVIAIAASSTGTDPQRGSVRPAGPPSHSAPAPPPSSATAPPPAEATFPFRPGWVPAGAAFDHAEADQHVLFLLGYTFGTVPSAERGLTFWSEPGPLPDRLRDGGTLEHTTILGRPATEGWSPRSRSYTVSILRPGNEVMTVLAYGFDRATVTEYATHAAHDVEYGDYPPPAPPR